MEKGARSGSSELRSQPARRGYAALPAPGKGTHFLDRDPLCSIMEFDHLTIALLVRRPNPPTLDPQVQDRLQDAHLSHLARLHDEGHLLAAGPLRAGPESVIRGVAIFQGTPDDLRAHAAADPLVHAGYLEYQFYPWMVPAGAVRFSRTRFPRSSAEAREHG